MKVKKAVKKAVRTPESSDSDSEYNSSDEELREAYAKGLLKPGLNVVVEENKKTHKNCVNLMKQKLETIKLNLPWVERLDMVNAPAPLAPELALQMQDQEVRRAKQLKGNKKLPQYDPTEDPVLNDFRRETMFHRQAQGAVMDGIARLKKLGIPTTRPDDYFAEMAKSDAHMHKVRENLLRKQMIVQRSEKVRQLRQQRKVGKQMQIEATLKKHAEKRKMLEEVKKYRKGVRKDLDFLDDKKKPQSNKKAIEKRKMRDTKYGFGGKKRGSKMNTRTSSADVSEYQRPGKDLKKGGRGSKPGSDFKGGRNSRPGSDFKGGRTSRSGKNLKKGGKAKQRVGKSRRVQMKAKKRRQ
ncbi:probable rRNA-processing protein EBP2 homolog [Ceratina calcarata]|uniref:Probable rRNA-processing protein EBP2 homolog n=1 Tax=Ceratina calcarata TaxID=156304 RepID=A0AAJ7ITF9_9HYME|nr:probable rRNA-processing protein EBP2 homolog [Ceratina calcarata]